jgi:O-antigen ligase
MLGLVFPDRITWLGLVLGFSVLPVAIIYSTRSAPLLLALAAVTLVYAEYRLDPQLKRIRRIVMGLPRQPLVILLFALSGLAMLSALWSPTPAQTVSSALKLAGAFFLGGSWCALVARFQGRELLPYLAGGLAVALLAFAKELLFSGPIRGFYTEDAFVAFELNRAIAQISAIAALFIALAALAGERVWQACAGAVGLAAIVLTFASESQSTLAFWLFFGAIALMAGLAARAALAGVVLAAGAALLAFPWAIQRWHPFLAELFSAERLEAFARSANVEHRLVIWADYARIVPERFWAGWGMKAERSLDLPSAFYANHPLHLHFHPHSVALELWTGLGLAGVLLAAAVLLAFAGMAARREKPIMAWTAALFAALAAVWLVSHGSWENWWLALVALTLGTLLSVRWSGPPTHTYETSPISFAWRPMRRLKGGRASPGAAQDTGQAPARTRQPS